MVTSASTPAIYRSRVTHARRGTTANEFGYDHAMWLVDLDDLPRLPWWLRAFARFESRDHLGDADRSIRGNLDRWLASQGVQVTGRVVMLTNARSLGYVFNPITVYWCHDAAGPQVCVVAEVHNTYGERHCYLLRPDETGRATTEKQFYVSPFLEMGGRYLIRVAPPGDTLHVTMALRQGEVTPFAATLTGRRVPVTVGTVVRSVISHPLSTYRVSALIRYQGVKLFLRKVPVVRRRPHIPQEGVQ
jgi:hypothetical protein